ncbi:MAG: MoxR family ATPase, partial [Sedimenticolaceae bacterium]|nr:MoxR family ATPase [Sedimenticolaceae bacterium]
QQVAQAVIGQKSVIREVITALIAGGHVLVEGVPGLGKTLLVRALTKAIGGRFSRIQFTPDLMPTDISGHALFDFKSNEFHIRKGPVFCNFLLADEINRAPAKTQSALLEAMQEKQVTIEGDAFSLQPPFMVMATQNPIEQEGTYPLPQAQLDRFLVKIMIDYPGHAEEQEMVSRVTRQMVADDLDISAVEQILEPEEILDLQKAAAAQHIDDAVVGYAVDLIRTTRDWQGLEAGSGPRGAIALLRTARAMALLNGNPFVTPDDIKRVAPMVLRHRIRLAADLEIEGRQPDDVLQDILATVESPRT